MDTFKQFLAAVFSRHTAVLLGVLVVSLLLWFGGPLLAVDGIRPLAAEPTRMVFIALVVLGAVLWLVNAPPSLLVVAATCLLVWHAGPFLSIATVRPLATVNIRLLASGRS